MEKRGKIFLASTFVNPELDRWLHVPSDKSLWHESMRVLVRLSQMLKQTTHSQRYRLPSPIHLALENRIQGNSDAFRKGNYEMRSFLARAFPSSPNGTFIFVFTIPLVVLTDSNGIVAHSKLQSFSKSPLCELA